MKYKLKHIKPSCNLASREVPSLCDSIRNYWFNNERYWITFARIKKNGLYMEADAAYRHMSWAEALRIVRCFPALPEVEEVIGLIEETYEWWYSDQKLCRSFKTFFKFLKYRTGSMRGALPGHCAFSFLEWPDSDFDSGRDKHPDQRADSHGSA